MAKTIESVKVELNKIDEKARLLSKLDRQINSYITGNMKGKSVLLPEQQDTLKDYYRYLVTERPKVKSRVSIMGYLRQISLFGRYIQKPFNQVTKEDIKRFLFILKENKYEDSTINEYKIKIKIFFKFLYQTNDYPEVVSWMAISMAKPKYRAEDELLSKQDIKLMIEKCDNSRDKALIAVLYESAARIHEFETIRLNNVIVDKYGIRLKLNNSKTNDREVRLIDSVPYLLAWLNDHPYKEDTESPLWIGFAKNAYGRQFMFNGIGKIIRTISKRAKITKHVHCHLFRHSRLNELGKLGFNERDLRILAGWGKDSAMPGVYLHYGEKELDTKLLKLSGIDEKKEDKQQEDILKPKDCPRCKLTNSATSKYCNSCGMALELKGFMQDQEVVKAEIDDRLKVYADIMANPEKKAEFERFKKIFFNSS